MPDWWERRYTGDDQALDAEATAASGMNYREMFVAYLDPTDPNAAFAIRTEKDLMSAEEYDALIAPEMVTRLGVNQ